jgi:hypothetical protein
MPIEAQLPSTKCQVPGQDANRALWSAVISRAVTDLTDQSVGRVQKEDALAWIRDDPGFDEVCELAGVDAVVVREKILRCVPAALQRRRAREVERPLSGPVSEIPEAVALEQTAVFDGVPA